MKREHTQMAAFSTKPCTSDETFLRIPLDLSFSKT
jgi:hypothetical protein